MTKPGLKFETVLLLICVSIAIRSYAGSILPTLWKTTAMFFLFPAVGAFAGKASGGFLADKIGAKKTAVFSLLLSAVLLAFGHANAWVYLIGIALFNMNMSVTLCAAASRLPLNPGLAFGITTLALLCGNVPTFFIAPPAGSVLFVTLTAVSTVCLCYILGESENYEKKERHGV